MLVESGTTGAGHGAETVDRMRKRNIYLGFGPASKKQQKGRLTLYRKPKASSRKSAAASREHRGTSRGSGDSSLRSEVAEALIGQGYKRPDARKMVAKASGADFASLFRDSIKKNPRVLPEMTAEQLAAIEKLIKGKAAMAQKKKKSKKKTGRSKMPAGLKAYWAKKRAAKARRRNPRKKRATARRRRRAVPRVRKLRNPARRRTKRARRRRSNPLRTAKRITLKGFTRSQIQTVANVVRRVTGKRVRVQRLDLPQLASNLR